MDIESEFRHPPLHETAASLEAHFRTEVGRAQHPLHNFHRESRVDEAARQSAVPAAVLLPIIVDSTRSELRLLLTRRHHSISSAGHLCFPGGHTDSSDRSPEETALREAEEEVGLAPDKVRVIGRLGDYVAHSGHRIAPIVGFIEPPFDLVPHPREVEEIIEIPLAHVFDATRYRLRSTSPNAARAHYFLVSGEAYVVGVTVSILMGFYEELLKSREMR